MTIESLVTVSITILMAALAPFLYIWRSTVARIETLEKRQQETLTKEETRRLIEDKTDSLKEDLQDIKDSLNRIIDKLIEK